MYCYSSQLRSALATAASVVGCIAVTLVLTASSLRAAPTIADPGQGPVVIADPNSSGASQLSGLAYPSPTLYPLPAGVSQPTFLAVSDSADTVAELSIAVDPTTGTITSGEIVANTAVGGGSGRDFEGVALTFAPGTADISAAVVSEANATITLFDVPDTAAAGGGANTYPNPAFGTPVGSVAVPTIYSQARPNLGLESLTFAAGHGAGTGAVFTVNEEALTPDLASGWVRIQRFAQGGSGFTADKQVAYSLQGTGTDFAIVAANGVSDLLALPDGSLLVLERALGVTPSLQLRTRTTIALITAADLAAADDTSGLSALTGAEAAAGKSVLYQQFFSDQNYEGIALGDALDEDTFGPRAYSLLLISDNGSLTSGPLTFTPQQSLLPLVIRGIDIPEPATAGLLGVFAPLALLFRGRCETSTQR